jgi:hypothetical protein
MMDNTVPRRRCIELMTPAELAISAAIAEVEKLPPSKAATNIIDRLCQAQEATADIVDDSINTRPMTFSAALREVKQGQRVARSGWNGKGMFLFLVDGSKFIVNREPLKSILGAGTEVNYCPHIDMKTADGKIVPWVASQTDLLASDWVIVK